MNKYFSVSDAQYFTFYKVPKILFTDEKYKELSTDAKMLYALLLDRMYLSIKNGWIDRYGRVYQMFTVQEVQELLHFEHDKVIRLFKDLEHIQLIERKRQGQGKPSLIYLLKI